MNKDLALTGFSTCFWRKIKHRELVTYREAGKSGGKECPGLCKRTLHQVKCIYCKPFTTCFFCVHEYIHYDKTLIIH